MQTATDRTATANGAQRQDELLLPPLVIGVQIQDARKVSSFDRAVMPGLQALELQIQGAGDEVPEAFSNQVDVTRARVRQELERVQAKAWESPTITKVRNLVGELVNAERQLSHVRAGARVAKNKVLNALRSGADPDSAEKEFLEFQDETRRLELRIKELPAIIAEAKTEALQVVRQAVAARASELLEEFKDERACHEEIFVRCLREHAARIALADVGIFMLDWRAASIRHGQQTDYRETLAQLPADLAN